MIQDWHSSGEVRTVTPSHHLNCSYEVKSFTAWPSLRPGAVDCQQGVTVTVRAHLPSLRATQMPSCAEPWLAFIPFKSPTGQLGGMAKTGFSLLVPSFCCQRAPGSGDPGLRQALVGCWRAGQPPRHQDCPLHLEHLPSSNAHYCTGCATGSSKALAQARLLR